MNINIIKCFKTLFTKEGLINNIGSYILISIILIEIILIILFTIKGNNKFQNKIKEVINHLINKNKMLKKNKKNIIKDINSKRNRIKKMDLIIDKSENNDYTNKSNNITNCDILQFNRSKLNNNSQIINKEIN